MAEVDIDEGHEPAVVAFFPYSDELTCKRFREVDLTPAWKVDETELADAQCVVMCRIVGIGQKDWVLSRRWSVDVGRALHVECLVRSLGVEFVDKLL